MTTTTVRSELFKAIILIPVATWCGNVFGDEIELPEDEVVEWQEPSERDKKSSAPVEQILAEFGGNQTLDSRSIQITYAVSKSQRGTTLPIPESHITYLCGDGDGCELRLAMFNWDNTGRSASRSALFYYNPVNRAWRSSYDWSGTNADGHYQHVQQAWSCYFTDAKYQNWVNQQDPHDHLEFGLLSWNQYNADCRLTIVD